MNEPPIGNSAWVDHVICEALEDGSASAAHLAAHVGVTSQRVAGRCRSLVNRGILKEVERGERDLYDPTWMPPGGGKWYTLAKD